MKNFKIIFLIVFFLSFGAHSSDKDNIIIRCEKQNFKCKGYFKNRIFDANIGKNGLISQENKKEGDLSTPIGNFKLQDLIFYKDKVIKTTFRTKKIKENYKWCDDSNSEIYNKFFVLNEKTKKICKSYENLLRNDHLYDFIIPIEYNMSPAMPSKGSAIFIHVRRSENSGTAGCVAFEKEDLKFIIENLTLNSQIILAES